jgi:hypothetical protein
VSGSATVTADAFIVARLTADTVLAAMTVWAEAAPVDQPFPFVLATSQDAPVNLGVGGTIIDTACLYVVRVVMRADSYLPLRDAADRIQTQLHGATNPSAPGGAVWESVRLGEFRLLEQGSGVPPVRHLGGLFRVMVT